MSVEVEAIIQRMLPHLRRLPIDLGFCEMNDHLLIGFGGDRFGFSGALLLKFELWVTPQELEAAVDLLPTLHGGESRVVDRVCLEISAANPRGAKIVRVLGFPGTTQVVKERMVSKLQEFQSTPYVKFQTELWKSRRC